jgi:hypothetical protein
MRITRLSQFISTKNKYIPEKIAAEAYQYQVTSDGL